MPIARADTATFLPSGAALVTAAGSEVALVSVQHLVDVDPQVFLLDPASGTVLGTSSIEAFGSGVFAAPNPSDGSVVLETVNPDSSRLYVARQQRGRIDVATLPFDDAGACAFDATGRFLLLLPHPGFDNHARILAWPSLAEVGRVEGEAADLDGRPIDSWGFILEAGPVLSTVEGPPILCTDELRPLAQIDLGGVDFDGENAEVSAMIGLDAVTFAVDLWVDGTGSVSVWRLAP